MSLLFLKWKSNARESYDWGGEMVSRRVEGREREVGTAKGVKECGVEKGGGVEGIAQGREERNDGGRKENANGVKKSQ